jgi:hypothetical protein
MAIIYPKVDMVLAPIPELSNPSWVRKTTKIMKAKNGIRRYFFITKIPILLCDRQIIAHLKLEIKVIG